MKKVKFSSINGFKEKVENINLHEKIVVIPDMVVTGDSWSLIKEDRGFIFRNEDGFGLVGYSETIEEQVEEVLDFSNGKRIMFYIFDDLFEFYRKF